MGKFKNKTKVKYRICLYSSRVSCKPIKTCYNLIQLITFPKGITTLNVTVDFYIHEETKILSALVSEHCANLAPRLHYSVNVHLSFTNKVSKLKLQLFLSKKLKFFDLPVFKAEQCFPELMHTFGTPCTSIYFS